MIDTDSSSEQYDSSARETPPPLPKTASYEDESREPSPKSRKERSGGCFKGCLITSSIVVVLLVAGFVACSVLATQGFLTALSSLDEEEHSFSREAAGLNEVWADVHRLCLLEGTNPRKVVHIKLNGTIDVSSDSGHLFSGENAAALTLRAIRRAKEDWTVDALLLEVDSGGGGITASDILYHELVQFKKEKKGRVVVVLMGDMAASGAYYLSLAADQIVAHPTTITGSIGVILPSLNVQQLTDRLGVVDQSITSGQNKAILNPMRELTEEQRALLQGTVDELYERFALLVSQHRKIPIEEVKTIADGRLYTATQAKELKLIDEIGYYEDAKEVLYKAMGSPEMGLEFFQYEHSRSLRDILSSPDFWGAAMLRVVPEVTEPGKRFMAK